MLIDMPDDASQPKAQQHSACTEYILWRFRGGVAAAEKLSRPRIATTGTSDYTGGHRTLLQGRRSSALKRCFEEQVTLEFRARTQASLHAALIDPDRVSSC